MVLNLQSKITMKLNTRK